MARWIIEINNGDTKHTRTLDENTHGNMRMYRDTETGDCYFVLVETYYIENGNFVVDTYVNDECVSSLEWVVYGGGKLRQNQLPVGNGRSVGLDAGWRKIKQLIKAQVEVMA